MWPRESYFRTFLLAGTNWGFDVVMAQVWKWKGIKRASNQLNYSVVEVVAVIRRNRRAGFPGIAAGAA
jgi:hypothetical protein